MATTFCIPRHVRPVIDDEGAVLLDIRRGKYFSLNGAGVEIWTQIEAGRPLSEIEEHIAGSFDVARELIEQDVADFVARLQQAELIHERD